MGVKRVDIASALREAGGYNAIIDVRSPAEFAEDHVPGAINWPVLDDAERAEIGTVYKQVSPFEARKRGAALVSRNIGRLIEQHLLQAPRDWRPLVYCWRGGQRSGSLSLVLGQIGFSVQVLEGGYQAFRREVLAATESLPARLDLRVLCGRTGSAKSRLLHALAAAGAQVLDLEALAAHKGSVLGPLPDRPQPSQKAFETALWQQLQGFDPNRPVFIEGESRTIGRLRLPSALFTAMHAAAVVQVHLPLAERVRFLLQDYDYFVRDTEAFCARLDALRELRGRAQVQAWQEAARAGRHADVVAELLATHYDPVYDRSTQGHYLRLAEALPLALPDAGTEALQAAARQLAG